MSLGIIYLDSRFRIYAGFDSTNLHILLLFTVTVLRKTIKYGYRKEFVLSYV